MAGENPGIALGMVHRVEQMCDFIPKIREAALDLIPHSMPRDLGAHIELSFWVGLGMVGIWAALDAYSERASGRKKCGTCKSSSCIVPRFSSAQSADRKALKELEDLRHLYAHNYGGVADDTYFDPKKHTRHVLARGGVPLLTCGAAFDGLQAQLDLSHLRHYCGVARHVLE